MKRGSSRARLCWRPLRITLPDAPAPYIGGLEARYLPNPDYVVAQINALVSTNKIPAPWWESA